MARAEVREIRLRTRTVSRRAFIGGLVSGCAVCCGQAQGSQYGQFRGRVVAEWLADGRNMRLTEPFEYIDPTGRRWPVPSGTTVDGASIPSVFWSIIGGPFEGRYRGASVIHDHYCDRRTRSYGDVHQSFHLAMLCAGVAQKTAWIMYQAVARFGPQWPDPKIDPKCEIVDENYDFERCARNFSRPRLSVPRSSKGDLEEFAKEIAEKADPSDLTELKRAIAKMR